jgi:glycosyltransferase involved in cell wall biosynthesis
VRRPEAEPALGEAVVAAQAETEYILEAGALRLGAAFVACALRHPLRFLRAWVCAIRTSAPGPGGLLWQLFYLVEAAWLTRRIEALGIEHVHNHLPMNSASVCMLAALMADVSWSMTVHGADNFVEPRRWALPAKLAAADFTVFIADFGRSQGMLLGAPSLWGRFHVIRCGLAEEFLGSAPTPVPPAPRLVFVGRLAPEKGVVLLLDAMAKLLREGLRAELVLVGTGPSRAEIESTIARLGLSDAVRVVGAADSARVREEILASRALVLPSFTEGLPVVLLEAFALHRPVVSTWVAGIPELVEPGRSGFLIPPGSVDELAEAMRSVLEASPERLTEMGRAGAARVAARHDASRNVRELEALIRQAVERHRRGARQG